MKDSNQPGTDHSQPGTGLNLSLGKRELSNGKLYVYNGPLSGVSLKGHGDTMLHPGTTVELPADHPYTNRLIKRGWLTEVPAASTPTTEKEKTDGR